MSPISHRTRVLIMAVLAAVLVVAAFAGIVTSTHLAPAGVRAQHASGESGLHVAGHVAVSLAGRAHSGGLLGGSCAAVKNSYPSGTRESAAINAPLGWCKLTSGLVPLPLLI